MTGGTRTRRVAAMVGLVAMLAVVAGCNLPRATANARCKGSGYAQDGTYVLKCTNGRWKRGITVAAADAALQVWISSLTTTTTAPPPAPAPARTQFGFGQTPVGTGSDLLPPGLYMTQTPLGSHCIATRFDGAGQAAGSLDVIGRGFIQIQPGDTRVDGSGSCVWTAAPTTAVPSQVGDGVYRVGIEITAGSHIRPSVSCQVASWQSLDGSVAKVDLMGDPFVVSSSDAAIIAYGCGNLG